jgi:kynurenine formamidase
VAQTNEFLVTASGYGLRDIAPDNLLLVNVAGEVVGGPKNLRPSKEIGFHLALYQARPEANAIIHVHPPYATALSSAGRSIPLTTISAELKLRQGELVADCPPGSTELCDGVAAAAAQAGGDTTILLLRRHGVVAFGPDLETAFNDAELAEDTAKIAYLEQQLRAETVSFPEQPRVVDLSLTLNEDTPYYPTDPPFTMQWHVEWEQAQARVSRLDMGAHSGTHVDAPLHFLEIGDSLEKIPPDSFMGPAVVIDAPKQPGANLLPADLEGADIRPGDLVLFRTGWEERAGTDRFFTDEWPGITVELVEELSARGVKGWGGDMPSADSPQAIAAGQPGHRAALAAGMPIFEALVNLAEIVGRRVFFIGLPLKVEGAEASPVRAVALVM